MDHYSNSFQSVDSLAFQKKTASILDTLADLGDFFELDFKIDPASVMKSISPYSNLWEQYNPYKPEVRRKGLSLTSLDGSMGGVPDLYSLREYYRREGKLYYESDFRVPTEVYRSCIELQPILNHFAPFLGRSHFLKFGRRGFFPPHRDGAGMDFPDCFRILSPINNINRDSFSFLLGDNRLDLKLGSVYFLNTLAVHSAFSFSEDAILLVCNIILNEESVEKLKAIKKTFTKSEDAALYF